MIAYLVISYGYRYVLSKEGNVHLHRTKSALGQLGCPRNPIKAVLRPPEADYGGQGGSMSIQGRIIGIRHRVKQSAEGEARPTQIAIWKNEGFTSFDLPDETAELDWVKGEFPVEYRKAAKDEDLALFKEHQIKWRKVKKTENIADIPEHMRKMEEKIWLVADKVPVRFDGLQAGDTVVMVLGGSGDYFAYALSRQAEEVGASIVRVPPFDLKQFRGEDKTDDAQNLIKLWQQSPHLFREVEPRDRDNIALRGFFYRFQDAMKARIACEQRLHQQVIGEAFCRADGLFPEGSIEKAFEALKASDKIFEGLEAEEKKRERAMLKHMQTMEVYTQLLEPVVGIGPRIAARLLVAIGDIRRFADSTRLDGGTTRGSAKLISYFGEDPRGGKLRRRRKGELANWHNEGRQALYLFADQCNRRPDSEWGKVLLHYRQVFRAKHPEVICRTCEEKTGDEIRWEDCQKKGHKRAYNDGHLLTRAKLRVGNKFLEWLWKEWTKLENRRLVVKKAA